MQKYRRYCNKKISR